jgi:hypothetical protein
MLPSDEWTAGNPAAQTAAFASSWLLTDSRSSSRSEEAWVLFGFSWRYEGGILAAFWKDAVF